MQCQWRIILALRFLIWGGVASLGWGGKFWGGVAIGYIVCDNSSR